VACALSDKKNKKKVLALGCERLGDHLDIVKIVKRNRALSTLTRLLLTSEERSMLQLQRRDFVLDLEPVEANRQTRQEHELENLSDRELLKRFKWRHGTESAGEENKAWAGSTYKAQLRRGILYQDWSRP